MLFDQSHLPPEKTDHDDVIAMQTINQQYTPLFGPTQSVVGP